MSQLMKRKSLIDEDVFETAMIFAEAQHLTKSENIDEMFLKLNIYGKIDVVEQLKNKLIKNNILKNE